MMTWPGERVSKSAEVSSCEEPVAPGVYAQTCRMPQETTCRRHSRYSDEEGYAPSMTALTSTPDGAKAAAGVAAPEG